MSSLNGDRDVRRKRVDTVYLEHNYRNGGKPAMYMQNNKSINTHRVLLEFA